MSIISINEISKAYVLGEKAARSDTLVGAAASVLKAPLKNFNALRRLGATHDEKSNVFWALRDVTFEIEEGSVVGIVGHNGAGKSTLLKILSQIVEPTSGSATIRGRVSSLLEVGTGFHPELSGRENIYMNGTILGMSKREIDAKFDEIVDFSGVEQFLDTPIKRYSSGMQVRLAFSVAAHLEPEVLVIDEVLAVGDMAFQQKCLKRMESVSKEGRTVVFVSHNLDAVRNLCTKGVWLEAGQVRQEGGIEDILRAYVDVNADVRAEYHQDRVSSESPSIKCARILNSDGQPCTQLDPASAFTVEFEVYSPVATAELTFGLWITNIDGQTIAHLESREDNCRCEPLSPGQHVTITCQLPELPLAPNKYLVSPVLRSPPSMHPVAIAKDAVSFYLCSRPTTVPTQRKCLVSLVATWKHQTDSTMLNASSTANEV